MHLQPLPVLDQKRFGALARPLTTAWLVSIVLHAIAGTMLWHSWHDAGPTFREPLILRASLRAPTPVSARVETDTSTLPAEFPRAFSPTASPSPRYARSGRTPVAETQAQRQDTLPPPAFEGEPQAAQGHAMPAERPIAAAGATAPERAPPTQIAHASPRTTSTAHTDVAYLFNPKPDYPPAARRRGLEGTVLVRVLVNTEGVPDQTRVIGPSGIDDLDQAAVVAVQRWRFAPAREGSTAIAHWVDIPIRFKLTAGQ